MKNFILFLMVTLLLLVASCTQPSSTAPTEEGSSVNIPSDYIARWTMDGNGNDSKAALNFENSTGSPTYKSDSPKEGTHYVSFDGSSRIFSQMHQISNNAFTFAAWAYLDSTAMSDLPVFIAMNSLTMAYNKSEGVFSGSIDRDNTVKSGSCNMDSWHHIVLTWDGTTMKLYLNGTLQGSKNATFWASSLDASIYVGSWGITNHWKGKVDDIIHYNRALSATEISNIYNTY